MRSHGHQARLAALGIEHPPPTRRRVLRGGLQVAVAAALAPHLLVASSARASTPSAGAPATPEEALAALRAGNQRFASGHPQVRSTEEIERIWTKISVGQKPFATVLGCSDSRLSPEILFDQFVGDLFVVREAGNIASSPTNLGSLEYGQAVLGSKLLLVLGHSSCGAVRAAFDGSRPGGNIDAIVAAIAPGIAGAKTIEEATVANVRAVAAHVRSQSPLLRRAEEEGKLKIAGAVYDIRTAEVAFLAS